MARKPSSTPKTSNSPNQRRPKTPRLVGKDLLAKLSELGDASIDDIAIATGYSGTNKKGYTRISQLALFKAIAAAKGVAVGEGTISTKPGRGKALLYRGTVHQNGVITVGEGYLKLLAIEPGDEFTIRLHKGYKRRKVTLIFEPSDLDNQSQLDDTDQDDDSDGDE